MFWRQIRDKNPCPAAPTATQRRFAVMTQQNTTNIDYLMKLIEYVLVGASEANITISKPLRASPSGSKHCISGTASEVFLLLVR